MRYQPDQIAGGLYGMLIGDALGVPYEFNAPGDLPPREQIEFAPPEGFERSHLGTPPGTWSDDGAMALCLLASLLDRGQLDPDDLGQRFVNWREQGYMAVDGRVFDIGGTTEDALDAIMAAKPALEAGRDDEWSQGNGSLMRVLPLALWHRGDDAALARDAANQSRITHAHPSARACCALHCLWARRTLEAHDDPWGAAVATFRTIFPLETPERIMLDEIIIPEAPYRTRGSGFVVDTLRSAQAVQVGGNYEQVVKAAVALGNDTDTTACVAGGIAGIRAGLGNIPPRWRDGLRGRALVEPLLEQLLAWNLG